MNETILNNSELLLIYDAKMTNPNGDLDDENRPRMDKLNKINLVSDVRLKRYVRDYLKRFKNQEIFYDDNKDIADAKKRFSKFENDVDKVLNQCVDVRLFGFIPTDDNANNITGPVQFTWGYSLNKVELLKSNTITSHFKTGKGESGSGIGKDYRVKYSLLAFHGRINHKLAEISKLSYDDIKMLDDAMIKAIPLLTTRSKIGQYVRLYLRIEMKNSEILKDLREYLNLEKKENLVSIQDVILDVSELIIYLEKEKAKIKKIYYYIDDKLNIKTNNENNFEEWLKNNFEIEKIEL